MSFSVHIGYNGPGSDDEGCGYGALFVLCLVALVAVVWLAWML